VRAGGATGALLAEGLSFTDGTGLITTAASDIVVSILPAGGSSVVASYSAPLSAFRDSAITVMASGFLSPNVPSGKDAGQAFGLFVVTASGRVIELPVNTTSVNSTVINSDFTLYPNPVNTYFEVKTKYAIQKIVLSTADGKVVSETDNSAVVNTDSLAKGLYQVSVFSDKGVFNTIIVK
jgi:hypothetical protein